MGLFDAEFAHLETVVRKLEAAGHATEVAVEQALRYAREHLAGVFGNTKAAPAETAPAAEPAAAEAEPAAEVETPAK